MHKEFRAAFTQPETRKMLARMDGVICVNQYIADAIRAVVGKAIGRFMC
jgi:hypothetical protein